MVKAAVVGVGYLGTFHAEKYSRSKSAELVAVVDVREEQAVKCAKKLGAKSLTDYRDLPALGIQCASVAADTSKHCEIALWLLEHGIDVLLEKPMAASIDEGRELVEAAKRTGRILQIGHLERFNPAFTAMKQILSRPRFFEARRIAQFSGRGQDVDVVLDLMIHDIDIIMHLVGRPIEKIEAIGVPVLTQTPDIANARLTFEGGAIANVTASRAAFKSERTLRVFQPDVYVSLDFGNKKLKMYTKSGEPHFGAIPNISVTERKVEERDALADEIESFLECVLTRGQPTVSAEDGLRALETAQRIREAFHESLARFEDIPGFEAHETRV